MLVSPIICILIGLTAFQTVTAQQAAQQCGYRPFKPFDGDKQEDYDRIVGGAISLAGDWPWACSMLYNGRAICGGSIINGQWIITAAHCVSSTLVTPYTWRCGHHHISAAEPNARTFSSVQLVKHENYNSRLIQHDIAIFKISNTNITFTDYIKPVCIPAVGTNYANKQSVATGWGTISSGGATSTVQREVAMPVLPDNTCVSKFGSNMLNPAIGICAGVSGANKDTCQGDSGGPLVVKHDNGYWYLIGLTSWGYGCGDGGVYTRVSYYVPWMEIRTGKLPG